MQVADIFFHEFLLTVFIQRPPVLSASGTTKAPVHVVPDNSNVSSCFLTMYTCMNMSSIASDNELNSLPCGPQGLTR